MNSTTYGDVRDRIIRNSSYGADTTIEACGFRYRVRPTRIGLAVDKYRHDWAIKQWLPLGIVTCADNALELIDRV